MSVRDECPPRVASKVVLLLGMAAVAALGACANRMAVPRDVSLVQLISQPTLYTAYTVRVSGFCVTDSFGAGLYLSRDDAANGVTGNGVGVMFLTPPARCDTTAVTVVGTFEERPPGERWPGLIRDAEAEMPDGARVDSAPPAVEEDR